MPFRQTLGWVVSLDFQNLSLAIFIWDDDSVTQDDLIGGGNFGINVGNIPNSVIETTIVSEENNLEIQLTFQLK